jgi:hypothetical protein
MGAEPVAGDGVDAAAAVADEARVAAGAPARPAARARGDAAERVADERARSVARAARASGGVARLADRRAGAAGDAHAAPTGAAGVGLGGAGDEHRRHGAAAPEPRVAHRGADEAAGARRGAAVVAIAAGRAEGSARQHGDGDGHAGDLTEHARAARGEADGEVDGLARADVAEQHPAGRAGDAVLDGLRAVESGVAAVAAVETSREGLVRGLLVGRDDEEATVAGGAQPHDDGAVDRAAAVALAVDERPGRGREVDDGAEAQARRDPDAVEVDDARVVAGLSLDGHRGVRGRGVGRGVDGDGVIRRVGLDRRVARRPRAVDRAAAVREQQPPRRDPPPTTRHPRIIGGPRGRGPPRRPRILLRLPPAATPRRHGGGEATTPVAREISRARDGTRRGVPPLPCDGWWRRWRRRGRSVRGSTPPAPPRSSPWRSRWRR